MKPAELIIWGAGLAGAGVASYFVWNQYIRQEEGPPVEMVSSLTGELVVRDGYVRGAPTQITLSSVQPGKYLRADAATAYRALKAAAEAAGHRISVVSAFRTMEEQQRLYAGWVAKQPGFNLAAKPGWSTHQSGLSADLNTGGFKTPLYLWLKANAAKYGFKNDVPKEHWHWTYQGNTSGLSSGLAGLGETNATPVPAFNSPSLLFLGGVAAIVAYQVFIRPDEGPRTIRKGAGAAVKISPDAFNG